MPKMKSHRGAAKRFKKTGTGKLTYQKRNGSDMWATYTAAGLIFQLYIAMYIASQPTFV